MMERFSHGNEADVFKDGEYHVVRVYKSDSETYATLCYLDLKIAQLLFPNNFIEVESIEIIKSPVEGLEFLSGAYHVESHIRSKLAPVPPEHAVFTSHSKNIDSDKTCSCNVCKKHREFHASNEFKRETETISEHLKNTGIFVPLGDESDYCLGPSGIIFFEVSTVNPGKTRDFVKALHSKEISDEINKLLIYRREKSRGAQIEIR